MMVRLTALLLLACLPMTTVKAGLEGSMAICREAVAKQLPAVTKPGLAQIDGTPLQLLAMSSYLRVRDLAGRWSWNDAEIAAYQKSQERTAALAEIGKVQARFAERNPGFRLHVNLQVRSLDQQIAKWNSNASVAAAAEQLMAEAVGHCDKDKPDGFVAWLRGFRPTPRANLAAPGLSAHGQGRAFDFQVYAGDRLVAGTDSRTIQERWLDDGWADRLHASISEASDRFAGPLRSPNEPWHYAYRSPPAGGGADQE